MRKWYHYRPRWTDVFLFVKDAVALAIIMGLIVFAMIVLDMIVNNEVPV